MSIYLDTDLKVTLTSTVYRHTHTHWPLLYTLEAVSLRKELEGLQNIKLLHQTIEITNF